jgi:hypothetical protein
LKLQRWKGGPIDDRDNSRLEAKNR